MAVVGEKPMAVDIQCRAWPTSADANPVDLGRKLRHARPTVTANLEDQAQLDRGHGLCPLLSAPRVPRTAARPQPHTRPRSAAQQTAAAAFHPQVDVGLRHPHGLDIEGAIQRGEVIVLNGVKAVAGEDNTKPLFRLLLRLVHRAIQAQALPEAERRRVSLYVDEAHTVLTPLVATMLAEGRSPECPRPRGHLNAWVGRPHAAVRSGRKDGVRADDEAALSGGLSPRGGGAGAGLGSLDPGGRA